MVSTRSLQIIRNSLERAIAHAQANDLVGRNVAALAKVPRGRAGRPSKSFTLAEAKALLAASEGSRWHAYITLSLLAGIRTEEVRALRWDHLVRWVDDGAMTTSSKSSRRISSAARRMPCSSFAGVVLIRTRSCKNETAFTGNRASCS